MSGFWDMGGYAAFIWPSYALVALTLVWLALSSRRRQQQMNEQASRLRNEVRGSETAEKHEAEDDR